MRITMLRMGEEVKDSLETGGKKDVVYWNSEEMGIYKGHPTERTENYTNLWNLLHLAIRWIKMRRMLPILALIYSISIIQKNNNEYSN